MMYFSGVPSARKKVNLGGRSSKEPDRNKLLEEAKFEREKRQRVRLEIQSAVKIQKVFRGRKAVAAGRQAVRKQFCEVYGEHGERTQKSAFRVESKCLSQLIFFYQFGEKDDFLRLTGVCRALHSSLVKSGDLDTIFSSDNAYVSSSEESFHRSIIQHRLKKLSYLCIAAIHYDRASLRYQLSSPASTLQWDREINPSALLLHTALVLTDTGVSWAGLILDFLFEKKLFMLLRDLLQIVSEEHRSHNEVSCLEHAVVLLAVRHFRNDLIDVRLKPWSFSLQILSIPLLFQNFPSLKKVILSNGIWTSSIIELSSSLPELIQQLPASMSAQFPSYVCLLGNLMEVSGVVLTSNNCTWQQAVNFATISRCLMEELSSSYLKASASKREEPEEMEEDEATPVPINKQLEDQVLYVSKPDILKNLVRIVFPDDSCGMEEPGLLPSSSEVAAMGEVCAFLYATFTLFPNSAAVTTLAYSTQIVSHIWHYMERCNSSHQWPAVKILHKVDNEKHPGIEMDGLLLPLSVFCPIYSYMLLSLDNEEFYEQEKPLRLSDVRILINILKEALWQLLWVLPSKLAPSSSSIIQKKESKSQTVKRIFTSTFFRQRVSRHCSRLLAQLQDWNSRHQFTPAQDFYAREAMDEIFFTQADNENSRARELLSQAPFLIPFTHRVRIYHEQLSSAKQQHSFHGPFSSRLRIRVRRDRIVEDAFDHLNSLADEILQGTIRVSFVNEFGVEEAGVDGGGIFKDFMENITKAAFDIQYGLFKETPNHLLYPNPASHMVHDEHLRYFEFLGKILGKAMFEGILVDIPFATFFLSKLKKKHNYLHDLQYLDPELYRSLLFLKRYDGDLTQLGLYFVIENNEYGEQTEVELLSGGRDIQVNNDNVIKYIHLVANYRLNTQIHHQSSSFLRGFQQLIQTKWIDMFNEHELQVLISGSIEGLNVDDLRSNCNYSGGYNEDHPVIQMFWEIVKTFNSQQQQKFLKFVTGCSRGPLLGFKYLEPQFCIQRAAPENVSDDMLDRLPTSATCMNLLKLPPYIRKEALQEKLLYAINADAGFDLS